MANFGARALPRRPSEALEDGRRWYDGLAAFATSIQMLVIHPSEMDVVELGTRTAVAFCNDFVKGRERLMYREARMLHPCEQYPKETNG